MNNEVELKNKFAFCPVCDVQLDVASCCSQAETVHPQKGDVSLCVCCGTILEFEDGCFVHEIGAAELGALKANQPKSYFLLMEARKMIIARAQPPLKKAGSGQSRERR